MKYTNYMSFMADFYKHGLEWAVSHTAEMGFGAVEILVESIDNPPFATVEDAKAARELLASFGLTVSCYSVAANLTGADREIVIEKMLQQVDMAAAFESPYLHHTLFPVLRIDENFPEYDDVLPLALDGAQRIASYAGKYGITCLYEPQGMYFNGVDGLGKFYSEIKKRVSNVGICGDTGNSMFVDVDPLEIFKKFSGDIKHLHVKNYRFSTSQIFHPSARCTKGGNYIAYAEAHDGYVDIEACFEQIKGYLGNISFEIAVPDDELLRTKEYAALLAEKYF